ncbi:mis18-binding protein 1 isoform 2-T2 [Anableps anableps]
MASCHLFKRNDPCFQSPAKVFAKLKSKVQKEAESEKELIGKVRKQHGDGVKAGGVCGADGLGFTRNPAGFCWIEELKENNRFASRQSDAQAVTLSPISSPEKTFDYPSSAISRLPLHKEFPLNETLRGFTRRNRVLMESTAVSQPLSGVFIDQIPDGFSRIQPTERFGRSVSNKEALPLDRIRSPGSVFSPMKNRLRKRKQDPYDSRRASRTSEESSEDSGPPQARRRPVVIADSAQNNFCRQVRNNVKGFPADHPEPKSLESGSNGLKHPAVVLGRASIMSPAKLFAQMKERESKREHQQIESRSRRELFAGNERNLEESRDTDISTNHRMEHIKKVPSMNTSKQMAAVNQNRAESPESQSGTSEDALIPASPSPAVLLEDPLVLNTPHISIPRKDEAMFRRNVWPKQKKFPCESVIHLRKWFLRRNHQGLFVDGIHVEENIQWNSNVIAERVSRSVLKTISGRVYILVGQMNIKLASDFPKRFLKKFVNGFPSNWKALYETFLSESKEKTERKNKDAAILAKSDSQLPSSRQSGKQQRLKSVETPKSLPSSSSVSVSRSGRVIKPPLEYWKGGRVILDAQMNVTIHEGYETSSPDVSKRPSKKPVRVFHPCSDGLQQPESAQDQGCSVLLRRVKADRRPHRAEANQDQKPADSSNERINSPKEVSGKTRPNWQRPSAERRLCLDAGPQKPNEPERSSRQRSKKQTQNTSRSPTRTSGTVTNPPESPSVRDEASGHLLCDYELLCTRRRRANAGRSTKGVAGFSKSEPDHKVSSNQSPEVPKEKKKSRAVRKRNEVQEKKKKESRSTKPSPPAKPSSWATQPGRKRQRNKGGAVVPHEKDGDEWTEDEIVKLQKAVSCYPKHVAGYWAKVARMVGTRSAEECYKQQTSQGATQSPERGTKSCKKVKEEAVKPAELPVISARAGTLKRKQQVRQFLETLPREDVDDAFSSAYMQNKRIEIPSLCSSEDHNFMMSDLEPQTPMSSCFPEVKTPQCLHITPGMIGSPNTKNDDKYVFQLQKRMKKNQFNVCKTASSSRKFTPTPSAKRTIRRCANIEKDNFCVWEMLPGDDEISESDEEEDFYFSDN